MSKKRKKRKPKKKTNTKPSVPPIKSLEQRLVDLLHTRHSKYHNYYMTKKSALIRYWINLIVGIISVFVYLALIFIVAKNNNKVGFDFIIGTAIIPLMMILSIFQHERFKRGIEAHNQSVTKNDLWLFKRGKSEFIGRAALFLISSFSTYYLYAISGSKIILLINMGIAINQILKFLHAIFILRIAHNPKFLLSDKIIAFTESLFYVGNLYLWLTMPFILLIYLTDFDIQNAEQLFSFTIVLALIKIISETIKRTPKIRKNKNLTKTHEDVIYFVKPDEFLFELKSEKEQFILKLTDYGRKPVKASECERLWAEKRNKDIKPKDSILKDIWRYITAFLALCIAVWNKEIIKNFQFNEFIRPIVGEQLEGTSVYYQLIFVAIIVLIGIWVERKLK